MARWRRGEDDWNPAREDVPGQHRPLGYDEPDAIAWHQIGESLYQGRRRFQISKREAARRAGISEALWRQLESGGKVVKGALFTPNPRPENLYAAARAVDLDPEPIFHSLEQDVPEGLSDDVFDERLPSKIRRLNGRDRQIVEQMVDTMLQMDQLNDEVDASDE